MNAYLITLAVKGAFYDNNTLYSTVGIYDHPAKWYMDWIKAYKKDDGDNTRAYAGRTISPYEMAIINVITVPIFSVESPKSDAFSSIIDVNIY